MPREALAKCGPLAHLVERFLCKEEVAGSNPAWSTIVA